MVQPRRIGFSQGAPARQPAAQAVQHSQRVLAATRPERHTDPALDSGAVLARLHKQLFALSQMDDLTALGLDRDADVAAVKAAYLQLSRHFHPHRFAKHRSVEIERIVTQIFVRIQTAHRRLTDVTCKRGAPNDPGRVSLRGMTDPLDKIVSETRKLLEFHQYDAAEAQLLAGMSKVRDTTALEVWLLVVRARHAKASGDSEQALGHYRSLLELDPSHEEARSEVEILQAKSKRGLAKVFAAWGKR